MAEALDASEFQKRVLEGTSGSKQITLEGPNGGELEGVEMSPVSKATLTGAIEAMPDDVFDAVEDEDVEDLSAEEAEEIAQEQGGGTVTEDMYRAFEDLCKASLSHDGLTDVQMGLVVDEFAFEMVFELGADILTFSLENSGQVTGFREQA